jgi:hypothetical protein
MEPDRGHSPGSRRRIQKRKRKRNGLTGIFPGNEEVFHDNGHFGNPVLRSFL